MINKIIKKSKKICKRIPDAIDAVCLSVFSVIIVGVGLIRYNRNLNKEEKKKNVRRSS